MIINKVKSIYNVAKGNYKFYILLVLFIMIFSAPMYVTKNFKYDEYTFENLSVDGYFLELTSDTVVKQNIETNGEIENLGVYTYNNNQSEPNGSIKVEVFSHQKLVHSEIIDMKNTEHIGLYPIDIPKMSGQDACVVFTGVDGQKGSSISLYVSDNTPFGSASINGEADKNISVHSSLYAKKVSSMHNIRLLSLFVLLLLFICSAILIFSENVKYLEIKLYFVSILMILGCLYILKPMSIITPETFAEAPRLYFYTYREVALPIAIFRHDAGYWPLVQRIVSVFFTRTLSNELSMPAMTIFGTVFMVMASSRFALPCFKKYYNPSIRFLISVFLGLIFCALPIRNELCTFINFTYAGIIIVFTNFLLDFKKLKIYQLLYVCLTAILMISKGLYVIFIPLAFVVALICIIRKENSKLILYSISVVVFGLVQLIYMYLHLNFWGSEQQSLGLMIKKIFYSVYGGFGDFIKNTSMSYQNYTHIINYLIIIVFCSVIAFCIKKFDDKDNLKDNVLSIGAIATAYFSNVLIYFTVVVNKTVNLPLAKIVDWSSFQVSIGSDSFTIYRWTIPGFFLIFFCAVMLINNYVSKPRKNHYIILIIFILSLRFLCSAQTPVLRSQSISNWKSYIKYVENDNYAIITNPPTSSMMRRATMIYIGDPDRKMQTGHSIELNTKYDMDYEDKNISGVDFNDYETDAKDIVSVYIKKHSLLQKGDVDIILYDKYDNIIVKKHMEPADDRVYLGFLFEQPVKSVYRFEFVNESGEKFSIEPEIYIGVAY